MLLTRNRLLREAVGLLETANLLLLRLALKNRAGARGLPSYVYRQYVKLGGNARWDSRSLGDLFPNASGIRATVELRTEGPIAMPIEEICSLAVIAAALRPRTVFEIGTFMGYSALTFAVNTPPDSTVYTLDLPPDQRDNIARTTMNCDAKLIASANPGVLFAGRSEARKIRQLYGESSTFDFSPHYGTVDFVFVDGAHHYDAVVNDTKNALRMVAPGGVIVWHDFGLYGAYNDVTRAVLDVIPQRPIHQVGNTRLAILINRRQ